MVAQKYKWNGTATKYPVLLWQQVVTFLVEARHVLRTLASSAFSGTLQVMLRNLKNLRYLRDIFSRSDWTASIADSHFTLMSATYSVTLKYAYIQLDPQLFRRPTICVKIS